MKIVKILLSVLVLAFFAFAFAGSSDGAGSASDGAGSDSENEAYPFLSIKDKTTYRIEISGSESPYKATLFPDGSAIFYYDNKEDKSYNWRIRYFEVKESFGGGEVAFIELSNNLTGFMIRHDQKVYRLEGGWRDIDNEIVIGKAYRE